MLSTTRSIDAANSGSSNIAATSGSPTAIMRDSISSGIPTSMLAQIGKRLHLDLHLHRALLEICRRSGFLFVVGHHRFPFAPRSRTPGLDRAQADFDGTMSAAFESLGPCDAMNDDDVIIILREVSQSSFPILSSTFASVPQIRPLHPLQQAA
jgi:hypothetical protein